MTWLPRDPSLLGLDPDSYDDGQVPVKDDATGEFVALTPVAYQDTPTVETLRDALVTLGLMEPAP